jgi:hypothetical protein
VENIIIKRWRSLARFAMAAQRSRPTALPLADQPRVSDAVRPLTSPCFIHSHLDNFFSVLDAKQTPSPQLGVAKSLQSSEPDNEYPCITKQLAETAVTVREMSKQLGTLLLLLSYPSHPYVRKDLHKFQYSDGPHCHESSR